MHRNFILAAAIFGGLAVALGAFGAHGLESITKDEKVLHGFHTGVQYQMYHALALLAVAVLYDKFSSGWMKWAGKSFIAGIILFSGSLFLLTFFKIQKSNFVNFLGPVTPAGGLFFIVGWLCLAIAVLKGKK